MRFGELIARAVAETTTSTRQESLMNSNMYFSIPQIGLIDSEGNFLGNKQLEPDYRVLND